MCWTVPRRSAATSASRTDRSSLIRRRAHRITFVAAGAYNIAWGCYAVLDPQWFFRVTGLPLSNTPQIFACLGMVLGLYGLLYLEVARRPEPVGRSRRSDWRAKILGPLGLAWLIATGTWPVSSRRHDHHQRPDLVGALRRLPARRLAVLPDVLG